MPENPLLEARPPKCLACRGACRGHRWDLLGQVVLFLAILATYAGIGWWAWRWK